MNNGPKSWQDAFKKEYDEFVEKDASDVADDDIPF
jgi:hypothetical protein